MIVSERIFQIMKEKGMSQKEFSDKTGISQSTVSDWKRRKTNPAADKLIVICEVLQMSADELLTGTRNYSRATNSYEMISKKSEEYELIKVFRSFNEENKNKVLGYIDALKEMNPSDS